MSVKALDWAFQNFITDSAQLKLIVISLADNSSDLGLCFPTQKLTAKKSCCSISTVKRLQKLLEENGVIEVKRKRIGRQKTVNAYKLNIHKRFTMLVKQEIKTCTVESITLNPSKNQTSKNQLEQAFPDSEDSEGVVVTRSKELAAEGTNVTPIKGSDNDTFKGSAAMTPEPSENRQSNNNSSNNDPPPKRNYYFPMSRAWDPSDSNIFAIAFEQEISETFVREQLTSFRDFWIGDEGLAHQGAWEQRFTGHVKYQHERRQA